MERRGRADGSSSMLTRADQGARRTLEALMSLLETVGAESQNAMLQATQKVAEVEQAALARIEERVATLMQPVEDRGEMVNGLYAERLTAFASRIDDAMEHVYKAGDVVANASIVGARMIGESSAASIRDVQRAADSFADAVDRANLVIERANEAISITARRAKLFLVGAILAGLVVFAAGIVIGTMLVTVSVILG
jgi:hypothetical protein